MIRPLADPARAEVAAVQAVARDWVVIWSPWRRTFTAIARFGPAPLIIDDADKLRLLRRCRTAETAAARAPIPARADGRQGRGPCRPSIGAPG